MRKITWYYIINMFEISSLNISLCQISCSQLKRNDRNRHSLFWKGVASVVVFIKHRSIFIWMLRIVLNFYCDVENKNFMLYFVECCILSKSQSSSWSSSGSTQSLDCLEDCNIPPPTTITYSILKFSGV